MLFQINRHGFKGPDFEIPKPASTYRILAIGDSYTWGPADDRQTYPRIMERDLAMIRGGPERVEVVNAGVFGYNLKRVEQRLDDYLAVDPDLVSIYIGWNRTIGRVDPRRSESLYQASGVYRFVYHGLINRQHVGGFQRWGSDLEGGVFCDADDPAMDAYASHDFGHDIKTLGEIITRIREHSPESPGVLITIAGLLDERVVPDERALQIAYPITSTLNLHAYSVLTRRWNEELRSFASANDVALIDFESVALEAFVPRSSYFGDSVHPKARGYEIMGQHFAREIAALAGWSQPNPPAAIAPR
ncbi:MAG: SGNH/GDSL hydrolase family protein [bacterium]|nr:SGNH/GDSL hydrolase family protein [bacterium]